MGDTIDRNLITQFSDMLHVAAQQNKARLRPYVQIKQMSGDVFAYDGLNSIEATEIVGRIQPVVFSDIEHLRRKIRKRRFAVTLPIDSSDVRGMLTNPQSDYAQACIRALERKFDRVGIEAMFATVKTGRDFETDVAYAADGVLTVDATTAITYEDLLEIEQNFIDNEVGTDIPEQICIGITGKENTKLMGETELTSGDFSRQYAVDNGRLAKALGMDIIRYGGGVSGSIANPILPVTSGVRKCFAMSNRALCYGMAADISTNITPRTDYVETTQVQAIIELGAVRTEGKLIQLVNTTA